MLPHHDGIGVEVGDVGAANSLGVLSQEQPTQVRVHQTLAHGVRVLVGVGVAVMGSVISRPPADRALDGAGSDQGEVNLQGGGGGVGLVRPQTVVACASQDDGKRRATADVPAVMPVPVMK